MDQQRYLVVIEDGSLKGISLTDGDGKGLPLDLAAFEAAIPRIRGASLATRQEFEARLEEKEREKEQAVTEKEIAVREDLVAQHLKALEEREAAHQAELDSKEQGIAAALRAAEETHTQQLALVQAELDALVKVETDKRLASIEERLAALESKAAAVI